MSTPTPSPGHDLRALWADAFRIEEPGVNPLTGLAGGIAIFAITNGIPAGTLNVGERTTWFAAGSLVGLVLMAAARAPRLARYAPENAAAADPPLLPAFLANLGKLLDTFLHDVPLRAHALRLATVVAGTTLIYRELGLAHGYWIPLTTLAVLQPEEHASHVRALQRGAGTLVGTVAVALLTVLTGSEWALVAGQGVAAFLLFSLFARSYFWLVVGLTPTALLTVSAVDYQGVSIALQRAGNSAIGIVVGIAVGELAWRIAPAFARPWRE